MARFWRSGAPMRLIDCFAHSLLGGALLGIALGCTQAQPNADGSGGSGASGGSGGSGGNVAAPPSNLSCLQILHCIADCTDMDGPCPDACGEQGSADGYAKVYELATCIETEGCTEATCVEDLCYSQLAECVASSGPEETGTPLQGGGPPGSIPGNLVGSWVGVRDGNTWRLTLNGDGTASWVVDSTWQQYACLSFKSVTKSGTIVVEPTIMTLYATSVVVAEQSCSPPATESVQDPVTNQLQWHPHETDPNVLFIIDEAACAAKKIPMNDEMAMAMYCTARMERQ